MSFLSIDQTDLRYSMELCFAGAACDLRTNSSDLAGALESSIHCDGWRVSGGFQHADRRGRIVRRSCGRTSFSRVAPRCNSVLWKVESVCIRYPPTHSQCKRFGGSCARRPFLEGEADTDYARCPGLRDGASSSSLRLPGVGGRRVIDCRSIRSREVYFVRRSFGGWLQLCLR